MSGNEIIHHSLICRAVRRCIFLLRDWWRLGAIAYGMEVLRRAYNYSYVCRLWERSSGSGAISPGSHYARSMSVLGRGLGKIGGWLRHSLFYRLLLAVQRGYLHLSAQSRLLGMVNKLSLHQWLLVAFGLYLPLEYLIRDTLGIAALASVWEEAFIIVALLLILWRRALGQSAALSRETVLDAWILLFFVVGLVLMSLVRPYPSVALPGYRIVMQYILWYFLILRLLEDDRDFRLLWGTLVVLSLFLSLHSIYQYAIGVEIPAGWVSQTEMGVRTRVFSLTGSPNILGSLLVLTLPLLAAGIYYFRHPLIKLAFSFATALSGLALLFTFSRGAWLGLIAAVIIFAWFIDKRLLALLGAAAATVLVFVPAITSRITYLFTQDYAEASAIGGRALRWELGRQLLAESHPWLGFGLGRFGGAVAMDNQILDATETFSYFYMDSYYLKTLVEMGYLGLIAFLLMLAALVYIGLKAIRDSDLSFVGVPGDPLTRAVGNKRVLAIALFSALIGVLTHCYFENIFEEPYMTAYFWGIAAMLVYLGFFSNKQTPIINDKK